jgi:hypothetical protein
LAKVAPPVGVTSEINDLVAPGSSHPITVNIRAWTLLDRDERGSLLGVWNRPIVAETVRQYPR